MLSSEFLEALLYQVLENPQTAQVSLVWGRVTEKGVPQKGVSVEMGGSQDKPIYFTGFAPDFERKETSENGLFAFITDREGLCPIRGVKKDVIYSVKTAFCQKNTVSLVELEKRQDIPISIKTYDPFSKVSQQARVSFLGEELELVTHKQKDTFVSLPLGSGDRFLTAESRGYELTHMNVPKRSFSLEIPLIKTSWLKSVLKQKNISVTSSEGLVLGFFEKGKSFELFLDGTPYIGDIVFFDSRGRVLEHNSLEAEGFLLTGLSLGFHNLSLFFNSQDERRSLYNEVLFVEPKGVNVMVYGSSLKKDSSPSKDSRQEKHSHRSQKSYLFFSEFKSFLREKRKC